MEIREGEHKARNDRQLKNIQKNLESECLSTKALQSSLDTIKQEMEVLRCGEIDHIKLKGVLKDNEHEKIRLKQQNDN